MVAPRNRLLARMAVRAWLTFLYVTSMDKWEQEWELQKLYRLEPKFETE